MKQVRVIHKIHQSKRYFNDFIFKNDWTTFVREFVTEPFQKISPIFSHWS